MNFKAHIRAFERIRAEWIAILVDNPGNSAAAQHILSINAKLELLNTLRYASGDFDEIN